MRPALLGPALVSVLLFTACSSASPTDLSTTDPAPRSTDVTTEQSTSPATSSTAAAVAEGTSADLAVFIAALEAGLTDTRYSGTALSDPEVYIATGQLFCEELDGGAEPALMLSDYLEILTGGDIGSADDDDLIVSGLLLGVSVEVLCPRHTDALVEAGF